ncbi:MAG: alpha/beta hydrolase [Pseudomonadota bacterium]
MTTLVLLPGLASDAQMWRAQLEALASYAPVVTDAHMRHDTIEAMAAALLADHPGDLVLCGASMGGMLAMEVARQAPPQRMRGLALLGTSAAPESTYMRAERERAIVLFAQGKVREVIEPNVRFAFHKAQAQDQALVRSYVDFVLRAGADALIRQNRAVIARPDARAHLPKLRCPVLVLCGDADQIAPPACSREIASLIPQAELGVVPQCGHMLTMEKPELVNAALLAWLEKIWPEHARSGG